jgi:hypothetical protein
MRRTAFLLAAVSTSVAACAGGEKVADTTAAADATPPAAAAAPARPALTRADVAGEWVGTSYADAGDSVVARWRIKSNPDSTSVLTFSDTKRTVSYKTTVSGDSLVSVSQPYTPPGAPVTAKVTFHAIGRLEGDTLRGVTHVMSAAKPDSMIATHRWVATRAK